MYILFEMKFPYAYNVGIMVNGEIRLSNMPTDFVMDDKNYYAGYFKNISSFLKNANLTKGGELEEVQDIELDIVDNGLLSAVELAGHSLNSGTLSAKVVDGATITPIWFGYVNGCSLKDGVLTIKAENLSKALKPIESPIIYGNMESIKIERDNTLSNKKLNFKVNSTTNYYSLHPIITSVESPKYSGSSTAYGVTHTYNATKTIIKIKYYAQAFAWATNSDTNPNNNNFRLAIKFITGANKGNWYQISSVTESQVSDHWEATLTISDELQETDIRAFDRTEIYDCANYFILPNSNNVPSNVSIIDNDTKFKFPIQNFKISTINNKRYMIVYPTSNLYTEIPIGETSLVSDSVIRKINAYKRPNVSLAIDNDYDVNNMCGFTCDNVPGHPDWIYWTLGLKPDLSKFKDRQLFFGIILNTGDYLTVTKAFIQYKLKSGESYPINSDGTMDTSDGQAFFAHGDRDPTILTSIPPTALPKTNVTHVYPFNKSQLVTLLSPETNTDIDWIYLTLIRARTDASVGDFGIYEIPKIGIYAKSDISDSLDAIYIDYIGNTYNGALCGANDRIAAEILTQKLGQTLAPNFITSTTGEDLNSLYIPKGESLEDAFSKLAKDSLAVIGTNPDNSIYFKNLVLTQDDTKTDLAFNNSSVIFSIDPLTDVPVSDIINSPKIVFKLPNGNEEYLEVISLDQYSTFPIMDSFTNGVESYNSYFTFSANFLDLIFTGLEGSPYAPSVLYGVLSSIWTKCKDSYTKNQVIQKGEISIETWSITYFLVATMFNLFKISDIIQLSSQRRKTISFEVPLSYGTSINLNLGMRVSLSHPQILQGNTVYGFLDAFELFPLSGKTKLTLIVDSFKLGDGTTNFF